MLLILALLLPLEHSLTHGEVVDTKTEMTPTPEWVNTGWEWEPTICFKPEPCFEWREVELGYTEYHAGMPLAYFVRLQSGDRSEWVEVTDEEYQQANIGEWFWR